MVEILTWKLDRPAFNSFEDISQGQGELTVDYTENVDCRWGAFGICLGPLFTTVSLSASGGTPATVNAMQHLTRMTGQDRQSTIRLNLRAIREGTQPDIYIKANDHVNIGTSFWATPLAVVRSGFRFTYGFGFLVDRNFGNDIFGPPPSNTGRGF